MTTDATAIEPLATLMEAIRDLPKLRLRGLMAIPSRQSDFDKQREVFAGCRRLYEQFADSHKDIDNLDTLSIGMSDDFEAAIAEGSTMVRIGRALFGERAS